MRVHQPSPHRHPRFPPSLQYILLHLWPYETINRGTAHLLWGFCTPTSQLPSTAGHLAGPVLVVDETEPDHSNIGLSTLQRVTSGATSTTAESPTHTHVDSLWERSRSRTHGKKDSADSLLFLTQRHPSSEHRRNNGKGKAVEEPRNVRADLEQDSDDADHARFLFTQFKLANMLDPKDLELEALGGINALLKGLGTNPTRGLGSKALMGSYGRPGPGKGASQRHDREEQDPLPGIAPDNLESGKEPGDE